ncbi:MAG: hypothetical protein ACPF8V_03640 [Luteibaculum sp.]
MTKIFPYFLSRIGGRPIQDVFFESKNLSEQYSQFFQLQKKREILGKELTDAVFEAIGKCEDEEAQKALLQLKRNLYNRREIDPGKLAFLQNQSLKKRLPCRKRRRSYLVG